MSITSFYFFCFVAVSILLYYVTPTGWRWCVLLLLSVAYYLTTGAWWLIVYPISATMLAYISTIQMERATAQGRRLSWMLMGVLGNVSILVVLKYLNFGIYTYNGIVMRLGEHYSELDPVRFAIPIGLSFYTLSIIGYVLDVYYGKYAPQHNFFRLLLFCIYYPSVITGPIVRYDELSKTLYTGIGFDYKRLTFGLQRIIWGLFKVLIISERLSVAVSSVYNDYYSFPGIYVLIATILFAVQLYTNFSGSIDILMGTSECLGVTLPENFNTPYFSKTITEFWQRWHITLGLWLKDYIFYPLLRTPFFRELPTKLKDKYGKKTAKNITTFTAMFIMWFTVGLWHGGAWKYIIGSGLLHWLYLLLEKVADPIWEKLRVLFHADKHQVWFRLWQSVRTFLLVSAGFLFFNSKSVTEALKMYRRLFSSGNYAVPTDGSLWRLGLDGADWCIVIMALVILFAVSVISQKRDVREYVASLKLPVRWCVYYGLLFMVILLGQYGPGYDAAEFIYRGF